MHFINSKSTGKASIYYKNNVIYKVNEEFIEMTGYTHDNFIGKSLEELTRLLRSNVNISCKEKEFQYNKYIFTSTDKPVHVKVIFENLGEGNKEICFIKTSSNIFLEGVLATCVDIHSDDRFSEAIYSYPDFIHLKTDKQYIKRKKLFDNKDSNFIGSEFSPLKSIFSSIEKNGYYFEVERKVITPSGDFEYYTIKADLIYEKGKAVYVKVTFIDDTKQVLARKIIEKQNTEMEIILDNIPDGIVKLNSKGEYTYTNKANLDILSPYRSDDAPLNSKETFKCFQHNDINIRELSFEESPASRVLRGEKLSNYILIITSHLPTAYYKCNATPIYGDEGNVESAVLIYRDITETYKAQEYNILAKNIKNLEINFLTMSYPDFKIEYINDVSLELIKRARPHIDSEMQVIGQNFFDLYTNDAKLKEETIANIELCIKNKCNKYIYTKRIIEEGEVKYIKIIFQPMYDEDNQVYKINCTGMYVTDEELANQKMSKSLKSQEEIFINTSHELKTPINLIFSASQLLNIYLENENLEDKREGIKNSTQIITHNCFRTIKLINNILDVSRMEEGFFKLNLENRNIVSVLDDMVMSVSDYIKDNELKIIFDPEVEEKVIALDLYKFERIMLNLISNAIKFSKINGDIYIGLVDKGDYIEITVIDKGIGINEENIDSIFDKFKQENKSSSRYVGGTGIGLSLVKSLVELHEGTISVESTVGRGSKFILTLPSKTVDTPVTVTSKDDNSESRVEMIRFELSDIYS